MTKATTKKKLAVLGNGFLAGIIVEAVSYTHLDVYKRQDVSSGTVYGGRAGQYCH